jgi:hypothetical protein
VPGPLARAGFIRRGGFVPSARPSRHASILIVWELADRAAAIAWLTHDYDSEDEGGAPSPATPKPPAPTPLLASVPQTALF